MCVEPGRTNIAGREFARGFKSGDSLFVGVRDVEVVGIVGNKAGKQSKFGVVRVILECNRKSEVRFGLFVPGALALEFAVELRFGLAGFTGQSLESFFLVEAGLGLKTGDFRRN